MDLQYTRKAGTLGIVSFATFAPGTALQPYIRYLAVQEADVAQIYRVLPDTGLVIGIQYRGGLAYHADHGTVELAPAGITGFLEQSRLFENTAGTGTVLVFFRAGGAAPFFRLPLHELAEQSVSLEHLVPQDGLTMLRYELQRAPSDLIRVRRTEEFLEKLLRPAPTDRLVHAALAHLHQSKGTVRMSALMQHICTSASPLEKRFRRVVGTTPKRLANVIRLQTAVAEYRPGQSLTELSYAAGFYDQAHFVHAFQTFAGQSPSTYFRAPSDSLLTGPLRPSSERGPKE